jgi:hypothetical protein
MSKHLKFETSAPSPEEDALRMAMAMNSIPPHMHDGLINYLMHGREVGSFLHAVLTNDLREAVIRADDQNTAALAGYVRVLYNKTPLVCWGSEEAFEYWQKVGGLTGYLDAVKKEAGI